MVKWFSLFILLYVLSYIFAEVRRLVFIDHLLNLSNIFLKNEIKIIVIIILMLRYLLILYNLLDINFRYLLIIIIFSLDQPYKL